MRDKPARLRTHLQTLVGFGERWCLVQLKVLQAKGALLGIKHSTTPEDVSRLGTARLGKWFEDLRNCLAQWLALRSLPEGEAKSAGCRNVHTNKVS